MMKNKIRILHVAQAAGGVDRYIQMLLKYLDKEKVENILVCSQDFHKDDYNGLVDYFEQIEMTRAIGGNDLKAIKEVRALIKKYNPDIVYAHSSKAGAIARVADIGLKNHCVYNPHGWAFNMRCSAMKKVIYTAIEKIWKVKSNYLKVCRGAINLVETALCNNEIVGKILYVADPFVDKLYGSQVRKQIETVGQLKEEMCDYNTIEYAMDIAERCIATDVNCIVGLGGGKVLDVCKYAAYVSKTPFLSIPTTAANDGLASPIAVLKRKDEKPKSLGAAMPSMILIDTEIIANGPIQNIKAGIGDTISNYMALLDWEFAVSRGKDEMNGYAYLMSRNSLDALMKTQYDRICPEFIEVLVNSLVLSGIAMDFAGSSRPVSGSEHLFSHALDFYSEKKNLHGLQVALGTVAVLKLIGHPQNEVVDYLKRFDVNVNPLAMGIDEDTFVLCMQKATTMRKNRYTYVGKPNLCGRYRQQ